MRVQKRLSRKIDGREYYKYMINLPKDVIDKAGILDKELKAVVRRGKIVIESTKR